MHCVDAVIDENESSPSMLLVGNCDIVISGLTSGSVKLQYLLPPTVALPSPAWTDYPADAFTEDAYKTLFISEHGVQFRLTGVSNNDSVYVRMARYLNK